MLSEEKSVSRRFHWPLSQYRSPSVFPSFPPPALHLLKYIILILMAFISSFLLLFEYRLLCACVYVVRFLFVSLFPSVGYFF